MTPVELDVLADKVAERLNMPLISSALPAEVGELLATMTGYEETYWLPVGAMGIRTEWTVNADASLTLRLATTNGVRFWTGTFRAVT